MKALVLYGSGVKGAYHLGAIRKLILDKNGGYDIFCGSSIGAFNAAFLCQYTDLKIGWSALHEVWDQIESEMNLKKNIGIFQLFEKALGLLDNKPTEYQKTYDNTPFKNLVSMFLNQDKIRLSGKKLRIVSFCQETGFPFVSNENDHDLLEHISAACSYPFFVSSVKINNNTWTNSILGSTSPLGEAIRSGATEIDLIISDPIRDNVDNLNSSYSQNSLINFMESLYIDNIETDLKLCKYKNQLSILNSKYEYVHVRILRPKQIVTKNIFEFSPSSIIYIESQGYSDAEKGLKSL